MDLPPVFLSMDWSQKAILLESIGNDHHGTPRTVVTPLNLERAQVLYGRLGAAIAELQQAEARCTTTPQEPAT